LFDKRAAFMPDNEEHHTLSVSITRLIRLLPNNDYHSARLLFEFYRDRLLALARKRLGDADRKMRDEEDIVGEVLAQFLIAGRQGQLPIINSRSDLLRMLSDRVNKRTKNLIRDTNREKRGGGKVASESDLVTAEGRPSGGLDSLPGASRSPDADLIDLEQLRALHERIIACMPNDKLREYAMLWLEGLTPAEIATRKKVSHTTVYRKMDLVLGNLQREFDKTD
jgi:DNA-directed RNA polymerase specialized sigma24 family protein